MFDGWCPAALLSWPCLDGPLRITGSNRRLAELSLRINGTLGWNIAIENGHRNSGLQQYITSVLGVYNLKNWLVVEAYPSEKKIQI